jgi:hypothetical protein
MNDKPVEFKIDNKIVQQSSVISKSVKFLIESNHFSNAQINKIAFKIFDIFRGFGFFWMKIH